MTEKELWDAIRTKSARIQQLADMEAKAALFGGRSADGRHWPEKQRHIEAIDKALDELEKLYAPKP